MSVNYTRINWEDTPSTQTPINAENLNAMDSAIDDLAGAVNDLDGVPGDVEDLQTEIGALKNDLTQGTFPVGNAENADQLTSTVGIEDKTPYLFRTSGGSVDIGDRETVGKIVGGTIVNNQLVDFGTTVRTATPTGNTTYCNTYMKPIKKDHVYVFRLKAQYKGTTEMGGNCYIQTSASPARYAKGANTSVLPHFKAGEPVSYWFIDKVPADFNNYVLGYFASTNLLTTDTLDYWEVEQIDLTKMLGASIADYIFSLAESDGEPCKVWLKKHFPKQFDAGYQAYDAGSMQSVSGLTEHRMNGFNLFNSEAGTVRIIGGMQYQITGTYTALSLDGTTITPDSNGKFTPTNNGTLTVTGGNATDTCVHFVWDGEKDGTYEPYKTWSYALDDSVTLRGIPKVDANGNLYYDGDEYLPDGTVNRRYGIVDLGSLNWAENITNVYFTTITDINPQSDSDGYDTRQKGLVCQKYVTDTQFSISQSMNDKTWLRALKSVYIKDTAYSDVVSFKTAMSGVYLLYPLDTPTTETADPYQATQIVDDWGTEEFVLADGAFPVPVGHDTWYQNNLRAKLEMSPDSPDGDGLYVVQQESGENTYVPLASTATIQDILTRLTALENA